MVGTEYSVDAEVKKLVDEHGAVPPPWAYLLANPMDICWRMGDGEGYLHVWYRWWAQQERDVDKRIAYFRRWPPPHCWLWFMIEAIWDLDDDDPDDLGLNTEDEDLFERVEALGFGSYDDFVRDMNDPKWMDATGHRHFWSRIRGCLRRLVGLD